MTKAIRTGCTKEKELLSWLDFHILLETVDLDDSVGHIFIVDTFFDEKNATKKQLAYNKIFPLIMEKQKTLNTNERSVFQLLELKIQIKINQNHIDVLLNLMPLCFQKTLFHSIWKI